MSSLVTLIILTVLKSRRRMWFICLEQSILTRLLVLMEFQEKILKLTANSLSPSLTKLFNQSLIKGIYPDDWKIAKVVPVFKNGLKNSLNNY